MGHLDRLTITSIKAAAFCHLHGLAIEIEEDRAQLGQLIFHISPAKEGKRLVHEFRNGASAPASELLEAHSALHRKIKLRKHQDQPYFAG